LGIELPDTDFDDQLLFFGPFALPACLRDARTKKAMNPPQFMARIMAIQI